MAGRLGFAVTLSKSLLGAKGRDGSYSVLDGDSLIGVDYGQDSDHDLWTDDSVDVTTLGVTEVASFDYVVPVEIEVVADVWAHLPHRVTSRTGSGGSGRHNLVVSHNGSGILTVNGPSGLLWDADAGADTAPARSAILHGVVPKTCFLAGDVLGFEVEVEVVGVGTGTSEFRSFHDPSGGSSSVDARTIFEVNL